jgi:hypothetical protein
MEFCKIGPWTLLRRHFWRRHEHRVDVVVVFRDALEVALKLEVAGRRLLAQAEVDLTDVRIFF